MASLPSPRVVNLAGFLACAGLIGYALFQQHVAMLEPCPLCIFQRLAVMGIGLSFLLAFLHDPGRLFAGVYAALGLLSAAGGVVVAWRHAWLQSLPPDQVPACGPGLEYMLDTFPLFQALEMVFQGSGECATVDWSFLGLSMPAWVLLWCVALAALLVFNGIVRPARRQARTAIQPPPSSVSSSSR